MSNDKKRKKETDEKGFTCMLYRISSLKVKNILKMILYAAVYPAILYSLMYLILYYKVWLTETNIMEVNEQRPTYRIYAKRNNTEYLKHVHIVLKRLGFEQTNNESKWDLLWAHDYPFRSLNLKQLQTHQLINHFPGCGYITNKVDLSITESKYIPRAFKIPDDKENLLQYVKSNPTKRFVQKSNDHRNIKIQNINELNFTTIGSFIQEFIDKPYLIDGYKFDVGIYTVITSVNPLRVYIYKADVLFRFCPVKYYPLNPENLDQYVVGDDYLPIWNVPSLRKYYAEFEFSMKDSFDAYVRSQGGDPERIWQDAYEAIREVILMKENYISNTIKNFGHRMNFFELIRFDFTFDENLNVYLMEGNMSPNLSSAHYPPNQLLYEQVLFNLFALVGIGQRVRKDSLRIRTKEEENMKVANKNLAVLPEICTKCTDCFQVECQLCVPCFTSETKYILSQSYLEHQNRMDFQRIFPPPITENMVLKDYTLRNQLLVRWYEGKCKLDRTWCY